MLVRFKGGARGIIYASQVSNGDENDLNIRVYGTKKSLEWHQEEPNDLIVKDAREPRKIYRRGNSYIGGAAGAAGGVAVVSTVSGRPARRRLPVGECLSYVCVMSVGRRELSGDFIKKNEAAEP